MRDEGRQILFHPSSLSYCLVHAGQEPLRAGSMACFSSLLQRWWATVYVIVAVNGRRATASAILVRASLTFKKERLER